MLVFWSICWLFLAQLKPSWRNLAATSPNLAPTCPNLSPSSHPTWLNLAPTWFNFEANMKCPRPLSHWLLYDETHFDHFCREVFPDPVFTRLQASQETILATFWSQAGQTWPQDGAKLSQSWAKFGEVGFKLDQVGTTLAPSWPKLAPSLPRLGQDVPT